jgi:3',5'-cyclic AMP phosphodiesterase CpdA
MPDCNERLQAFINEMNREKVDFIIQLGDFSPPNKSKQDFFDIWNSFKGPKYHVLGNHDRDNPLKKQENNGERFTWEQVTSFFNKNGICPGRYYSFDSNSYHFVVLDSNEERNDELYRMLDARYHIYPCSIQEEQKAWLKEDIRKTDLPVVLFLHAGLDREDCGVGGAGGVFNPIYIRQILEQENDKAGWKKVQMVLTGHYHSDYVNIINGIYYVQINSMAFGPWLTEEYAIERYEHWVYEKYPSCKYALPYKDPLWTIMTIHTDGLIHFKGMETDWVGPLNGPPETLGGGTDVFVPQPRIKEKKIVMDSKSIP